MPTNDACVKRWEECYAYSIHQLPTRSVPGNSYSPARFRPQSAGVAGSPPYSVQEQVRGEFAVLRSGAVAVEVSNALLGEHVLVDEEIARAFAARTGEDRV